MLKYILLNLSSKFENLFCVLYFNKNRGGMFSNLATIIDQKIKIWVCSVGSNFRMIVWDVPRQKWQKIFIHGIDMFLCPAKIKAHTKFLSCDTALFEVDTVRW
jgi:hypothetical protein